MVELKKTRTEVQAHLVKNFQECRKIKKMKNEKQSQII